MKRFRVIFMLPAYLGSNHSLFLGIGYLAAAVKRNGDESIVIDEDAIRWIYADSDDESEIELSIEKAEKRVLHEIAKYKPDLLCMSINTANYKNALRMLKYIRHSFPDIYMIVGGPHISTCFECFKNKHSDLFEAAIIGEGEDIICELINKLKSGLKKPAIPGVMYSDEDNIYIPGKMVEINSLPFPDRDAFFKIYDENEINKACENYSRVFYSHLPGFENGHARIVASRGCYNNCTFCSPGLYWKDPQTNRPCRRVRTAESIVDEIEMLAARGVNAIYFDDPTFPIKSDLTFFKNLEREIKDRDIKISWGAPICSNEIDSNILDRLQSIGFTYTYFGLESYKEENLKEFHKKQDIDNCLELIQECKKRGIHCDASYQIGLPNESVEDIKKSIDWIFKNKIERNTFYSITAIWPQTGIAHEYGVTPELYEPDFDKSDFERKSGLFFYEQGNKVVEQFYSNCSGTYHFIPMETAIEMKYYIFDSGLTNRFAKKRGS